MHIIVMINALICINKNVITCINSTLSELTVEEGDSGFLSEVEEIGGTEETRGEGEERGGGGEGTKERGSGKTTRGEKQGGEDAAVWVRESEGEEKKGEFSWKATSIEVT